MCVAVLLVLMKLEIVFTFENICRVGEEEEQVLLPIQEGQGRVGGQFQ